MRRKVIGISIIICGLCIACLPFLLSNCTQQEFSYIIGNYNDSVSEQSDEQLNDDMNAADEYNRVISSGIGDAENYYNLLSYGDESTIGYITIPKINVSLPIYHGTTDEVLSKGVGHMEGTSLPIGGASTHSVLVGHTGLSYEIFDRLSDLKQGDKFYITVQDRKIEYSVVDKTIVKPDETDYGEIITGMDYCTLVTCYPLGINSHRLLVTGEHKLQ